MPIMRKYAKQIDIVAIHWDFFDLGRWRKESVCRPDCLFQSCNSYIYGWRVQTASQTARHTMKEVSPCWFIRHCFNKILVNVLIWLCGFVIKCFLLRILRLRIMRVLVYLMPFLWQNKMSQFQFLSWKSIFFKTWMQLSLCIECGLKPPKKTCTAPSFRSMSNWHYWPNGRGLRYKSIIFKIIEVAST